MQFAFTCGECESELVIGSDAAGRQTTCVECGAVLLAPPLKLGPGLILGGFLLERSLGKGAMGEVFLATQLSMGRQVAVKTLPPQMALNEEAVARFLHEVDMTAALDHPNIVTAFDAGEDNGTYFLAMSFVDGRDLKSIVDRDGPMAERRVWEILRDVGRALDYAWREFQMLHRDVKPENIMIDRHGTVRLMDMGISKSLNQEGGATMAGMVVGTPHYMSPEQAWSEEAPDCRADIYSLGGTAYYLLTGRPPYVGGAQAVFQMLAKPEPIDPVGSVAPGLSAPTCALVGAMLASERDARHGGWPALLKDVERVIGGVMPEHGAAWVPGQEGGRAGAVAGGGDGIDEASGEADAAAAGSGGVEGISLVRSTGTRKATASTAARKPGGATGGTGVGIQLKGGGGTKPERGGEKRETSSPAAPSAGAGEGIRLGEGAAYGAAPVPPAGGEDGAKAGVSGNVAVGAGGAGGALGLRLGDGGGEDGAAGEGVGGEGGAAGEGVGDDADRKPSAQEASPQPLRLRGRGPKGPEPPARSVPGTEDGESVEGAGEAVGAGGGLPKPLLFGVAGAAVVAILIGIAVVSSMRGGGGNGGGANDGGGRIPDGGESGVSATVGGNGRDGAVAGGGDGGAARAPSERWRELTTAETMAIRKDVDAELARRALSLEVDVEAIAGRLGLDWPVQAPTRSQAEVEAAVRAVAEPAVEKVLARRFPDRDFEAKAEQVIQPYRIGDTVLLRLRHGDKQQVTGTLTEIGAEHVTVGGERIPKYSLSQIDQVRMDRLEIPAARLRYVEQQEARVQAERAALMAQALERFRPEVYRKHGYVQRGGAWRSQQELLAAEVKDEKAKKLIRLKPGLEREVFEARGCVRRGTAWGKVE